MMRMKYNCELEAGALDQARLCSNTGSGFGGSNFGENIAQINRSAFPTKLEAIRKAISNWWKQSRGPVNIGPNVYYRSKHISAAAQFAQMAWHDVDQVGCGIAECNGFHSVVCHYSPQGVTVEQQIYRPGAPCSACPGGTTCTEGALCN
ncbi:unnamed protein product [Strongylus vulgaris]|uniref:SCP domain-containing protein n=1 Tax=Strongylus vulgaris TaxID=40348 RepID=A0A3P7IJ41_STRVU|nr:unnamed protein product [Strongylus vulgaris]